MDEKKTPTRVVPRALMVAISLLLAAVWLIPGAVADENRAVREFPDPSRAGFASASDFRAIDAALVDRLGAKGLVVDVLGDAVIAAGLSPTSTVFRGPSGEPYLSEDVLAACLNRPNIAEMDGWSRELESYLGYYGIDFLWAIAPDKSSVMREEIGPAADLLMRCADANRATLEAAAASDDSPLIVAWDELIDDPERTYLFGDSHWNSHGSVIFSELLLDRLADEGLAPPGIFDESALVRRLTYHPNGGLYLYMGGFRPEPTTLLATARPEVATIYGAEIGTDGGLTQRWVSTGPGVIPGRTLVLHDSFWYYNDDVLGPYFADVTSMSLSSLGTPTALAMLDGYDLVIIQQVQRGVPAFTDGIAAAATWITAGRTHEEAEEAPVP